MDRESLSPHSSSETRQEHRRVADKWLSEHGDGSLYIAKELGFGGFSSCWLLWSSSTEQEQSMVALKLIDRAPLRKSKRDYVKRELSIHSKLSHSNIVQFYRYGVHKEFVLIFMEYCSGGSLAQRIRLRPLEERELIVVIKQLLSALYYLHSRLILHRDLKPGNLLISEPDSLVVKLADFGLSIKLQPGEELTASCGTPYYFSPEMVSGKPYSFPSDIWSFGILVYAAFAGAVPFEEKGIVREEIFKRIQAQPIAYPSNMSKRLIDFLSHILCRDPKTRASLIELKNNIYLN